MRGIANLVDPVLTQYCWHSFASKALRLFAMDDMLCDGYDVRGAWRVVERRMDKTSLI